MTSFTLAGPSSLSKRVTFRPPSFWRRSPRKVRGQRRQAGLHQFDAGHGGGVAGAGTELEDAQVPAVAVGIAGGDLGEQLVRRLLVVHAGDDEALLVHAPALRLRDQLLRVRAQRLGLGDGGGDRTRLEQVRGEVRQQLLLVRGTRTKARALPRCRHGRAPYSFTRRESPRSSSFCSTSSSDFEPKFVMASRSSSDFWTN